MNEKLIGWSGNEKGDALVLNPDVRIVLSDLLVDDWAVSAQAFSGLRIQVSRQRKVPGHSFEADAQFDVPETVSSELPLPLPQNLIIRYSGAAALELYGRFAATVVSAGEPIGSVHIHGIEAVELRGSCL